MHIHPWIYAFFIRPVSHLHTLTTVQVPNVALTHTKRSSCQWKSAKLSSSGSASVSASGSWMRRDTGMVLLYSNVTFEKFFCKRQSSRELSFLCLFRGFLLLTFVRGISESQHQRIWNQHEILRFFDTHIDIFQEKNFLGHNSTFSNLKMQMQKKLYIFKHFAKSKNLFFCQYLSFSVWFLLKFQKKDKIEAP